MLRESPLAAVLVENNRPLEIVKIKLPEELQCGQVLVKVLYSTICGAQINEIEGAKGPDKFLPHLLGHEGSAIVLKTGPGVTTLSEGDHVVMHWRPSDGVQCVPPKYTWNEKVVNAGWVTTFNELAIVSENRLTVIPADFDMQLAPLFGCAITTAIGVVNNDANIKIGQSVAVIGVGGVGLNVVQASSMVSAHPVVAVDICDKKLEMAMKFGATHTINSSKKPDFEKELREIVGKSGAEVIIDTTGKARVIEQAYNLTHPSGKTILVGVPKKGDNVSIYTLPLHFQKVLTGSHGGGVHPHIEIPRLIKLFKANKLQLKGIITHHFSLENINEAITILRNGHAGRCLIKMN